MTPLSPVEGGTSSHWLCWTCTRLNPTGMPQDQAWMLVDGKKTRVISNRTPHARIPAGSVLCVSYTVHVHVHEHVAMHNPAQRIPGIKVELTNK